MANTLDDTILEIECVSSCLDYANSSSSTVSNVTTIASIHRPRGLWMTQSLNPEKYNRLYVVGGDEGDGYLAYVDLLEGNTVHYIDVSLKNPVSLFEDMQRPNNSRSDFITQSIDKSIAGLFVADTQKEQLDMYHCLEVIHSYI